MEHEFWHERWRTGQLGFHLQTPNPHLEAHAAVLESRRRVLVPLCGKSHDLGYLAERGHEVIGVELSRVAAEAYFAEHGLTPTVDVDGPFERFQHGETTILVGDFFDVARAFGPGSFDAAFDRAALIALPPEMRGRYVETLRSVLAKGAAVLLVSLEYDAPGGPPFSVDEAEVRAHYAGCSVESLADVDASATVPGAAQRGATRIHERVYRILIT